MIHKLTEMVMSNIGLDVDSQFRVIDQDYGNIMIYEGKYLKCSYNNEEPMITNNDIHFELTKNIKLMEFIFSYFLYKLELTRQLYFSTYSILQNEKNETSLDLKGYIDIRSDYYKSHTLKYMDIIFKLSGYPDISFLKKYDNMVR